MVGFVVGGTVVSVGMNVVGDVDVVVVKVVVGVVVNVVVSVVVCVVVCVVVGVVVNGVVDVIVVGAGDAVVILVVSVTGLTILDSEIKYSVASIVLFKQIHRQTNRQTGKQDRPLNTNKDFFTLVVIDIHDILHKLWC